jgi:hypothetical protein
MVGAHDVPVSQLPTARPAAARSSDTGWVMVLLMITVAIAAIAGIVVAVMNGHNDIALAVGIIGSAFFTRAAC